MRQFRALAFVPLLLCVAGKGFAAPITYDVTVDTSSIAGTAGSLDFNFNPGPLLTQDASIQILGFAGGLTGLPSQTGDVSGALPSTLTFDNRTALNDSFQGVTYGSTLSFAVRLFGAALTSPNGATSGSTFAFSMFSDPSGTTPILTSDTTDGFAFLVNVNLDGTTTVSNFSTATTVTPVSTVPLPASALLFGSGLAGLFGTRRRKHGS